MLLSAFVATAAAQDAAPDGGYVLGNGYNVPGTGWNLGGYATASYDRLDDATPRLDVDNLSLFLWWEGDSRWKFFTEIELENFASIRPEDRGKDGYVSLERAYLDYALTDTLDVRAGKFLTPVGRWNTIHATPLVWTTSRPLTTTLAFPTNMTGVMLTGTLAGVRNGIEYSVYGSHNGDLRPNPDVDPFFNAFGLHATLWLTPESQIGFSYADFAQARSRSERKRLAGVDFLWTRARWELSGEAIYRASANGGAWDEKGAFVQLAAPLTQKLFAVGRFETFRSAREPQATQLRVAGLNYRLRPGIVLKAEWIGGSHDTIGAPTGFMSSISILL